MRFWSDRRKPEGSCVQDCHRSDRGIQLSKRRCSRSYFRSSAVIAQAGTTIPRGVVAKHFHYLWPLTARLSDRWKLHSTECFRVDWYYLSTSPVLNQRRSVVPPKKTSPLTDTELEAFELQRDLASDLLESVPEMKAGMGDVVYSQAIEVGGRMDPSLFEELESNLKEAKRIVRGETEPENVYVHLPRKRPGLINRVWNRLRHGFRSRY